MVWPTLGSRKAKEQNRTSVTDRQTDRHWLVHLVIADSQAKSVGLV